VLARISLALCLTISVPTLLQAQVNARQYQQHQQRQNQNPYQNQQQQQQGAMQTVEVQGRIQGVAKGGIVVATNDGQAVRVAVFPATKIRVTGTTTANLLRAGVVVEFVADIDDNGVIKTTVDGLTLTSLTRDKQMGAFPAEKAKGDDVVDGFGDNAKKEAENPGDAGGKRGKRPPRATGKATAKAAAAKAAGTYRIVGKLNVGRNGAMAVLVGRTQLPFQLADGAKIDVDMADFSLVTRGNEVSIKGYPIPGKQGMMQAAEIEVKLPESQAAGGDVEPPARSNAKKPAGHVKKGQDEPLPEPASEPQ
jgi:hypothetical protein